MKRLAEDGLSPNTGEWEEGWRRSMDQQDFPGTPKWVRLLVIAVLVLIIAFIGLHLTGLAPMGGHGT